MLKSFSPQQLEQMKRDARRASKRTGVSHSAALNSIAREHKFKNWSLLVKHQRPELLPTSSEPASSPEPASQPAVCEQAASQPQLPPEKVSFRFFEVLTDGSLRRMPQQQVSGLHDGKLALPRPAGEVLVLQAQAVSRGRRLMRLQSVTGSTIPLDAEGYARHDLLRAAAFSTHEAHIEALLAGRPAAPRPSPYYWPATPEQIVRVAEMLSL